MKNSYQHNNKAIMITNREEYQQDWNKDNLKEDIKEIRPYSSKRSYIYQNNFITLKDKVKLIIPEHVIQQINYLHDKVGNCEWSGVLFYKVEGTIANPKDMILNVIDFYLMDIGSPGYTGYKIEDIFTLYEEAEVPLGTKIGNLHTHWSMEVFFSGTDKEDLEDGAKDHNYYLSLIVNNKGERLAKLAYIAKSETTLIHQGENGEVTTTINNSKMVVIDCDIELSFNIPDKIAWRYNQVRDAKLLEDSKRAKDKSITPYKQLNITDFHPPYSYMNDDLDKDVPKQKIPSSDEINNFLVKWLIGDFLWEDSLINTLRKLDKLTKKDIDTLENSFYIYLESCLGLFSNTIQLAIIYKAKDLVTSKLGIPVSKQIVKILEDIIDTIKSEDLFPKKELEF